ncbi:16557_t:CDS:1, partial [Funneliformis caledonium]
PGEISQVSELPLTIKFNKKILVKDFEKYKTLHSDMKNVLDIVVKILVNKASAEDESLSKKKARVEGY